MLFKRLPWFIRLLLSTFLSISFSVCALNEQVKLANTPQVCQIAEAGDTCQLTLSVAWQANKPLDACLLQDDKQLQCWQKQQTAQEKLAMFLKLFLPSIKVVQKPKMVLALV